MKSPLTTVAAWSIGWAHGLFLNPFKENTAQRRRRLAVDRDDGGGGEYDGDGGGGGFLATVRWQMGDISKSVVDQRHNVKLQFISVTDLATDQRKTRFCS
ncbi:hypothetical protein Scep_025761 [Stephania cephalantha]|uniref:Uncharacterized protein n=1 Tax=Stephania cephalantha TaxID=152367 RepID=A0AAP0EP28_9MAGN